jgi:hypothetical protein
MQPKTKPHIEYVKTLKHCIVSQERHAAEYTPGATFFIDLPYLLTTVHAAESFFRS